MESIESGSMAMSMMDSENNDKLKKDDFIVVHCQKLRRNIIGKITDIVSEIILL